jgi:ethanolamine ammonia-lyase small subunit
MGSALLVQIYELGKTNPTVSVTIADGLSNDSIIAFQNDMKYSRELYKDMQIKVGI